MGRWMLARGSFVLWAPVAVLFVAVAVGEGSVGAQKIEPTDTTAAVGGSGSVTRDHGGEQPPNCSHGEVTLADGTTKCRRCTELDHYWNNGACVPKMTSAPSDPTCSAAEILDGYTVYFSSYGGCRPPSCPGGRTSTGWCRTGGGAPPPGLAGDPTPPTDVTADGHSPTDASGQSVISWEASDAAIQNNYTLARYELRYGVVGDPSDQDRKDSLSLPVVDLLPDEWLPQDDEKNPEPLQLSATTTEHTLTGLTLDTLYRVEVMAVYTAPPITSPGNRPVPQPDKLSEWRHAYTYPTHDPISTTAGLSVGVIPITGFRPADPGISYSEVGQYRYVLCTDGRYLPTGISDGNRSILFGQVVVGIRTWGDAYDDIDILYNSPKACTDQEVNDLAAEVDLDETARQVHLNVIIFAARGTEIKGHCMQDAPACASNHPPYAGPIRSTKIVIKKSVEYKKDLKYAACTEAFAIAMHEAGHVFGLGDTQSTSTSTRYGYWPTVMSSSSYYNCEPTALDIAAIKAIYQSR